MSDGRFVTISSAEPRLTVTAILGQNPPVPADGYGGWTLVPRPRRKALTEWDGINPLRILVPIVLGVKPGTRGGISDGAALNISAVPDREALERMAQPPSAGAEPPLVTVTGNVPHANDGPWVIESFDWDPSPLYANGFLVRQAVTVHLLEYVRDDRLADVNAAAQTRKTASAQSAAAAKAAGGNSNQPTKAKVYIVKAGDTLTAIAARVLGNYKRWTDIAKLNGINDPKSITPGQTLRLP